MRARIVLAMLILGAASGLTGAQDKPLDRSDLDKRVVLAVYESARLGTDLFNPPGNNHEGCFRLYQGTLIAVHPLLDHRPKLQASVKARLDKAAKMDAAKGAFELRAALDEIQNEIAPPKNPKDPKDTKTSLWERLGGEKGVRAVVHDVTLAALEDKNVNFFRDGKVKLDPVKGAAHVEQMLVEMISQATGGPLKYTGKDMKEVHKGMMITDKEFDALGAILVSVLKKHKVAQADIDELLKIVEGTRKDIVEKK